MIIAGGGTGGHIFPALTENDESFCEDVLTTAEYHQKRKKTAKEIWLAEYMQQPVDIYGRTFNALKFITQSEFDDILNANKTETNPKGYEGCLGYIDVSDQGTDYTALALCVVVKNQLFVCDYLFTRDNIDITVPLSATKLNDWGVSYCRVESNSMGAVFARQLQTLTPKTKILQVHNTTNKITRIIMQSAFIQNSMIFVQKNDARYRDWETDRKSTRLNSSHRL